MFQSKKVTPLFFYTASQILQQFAINECCTFMASTEIGLFAKIHISIHTTVDLTECLNEACFAYFRLAGALFVLFNQVK